jgi:hypothetical protein
MPTAAAAATKWSQNLGAAVNQYTAGVQAVTQAPGAAAAAAADRYVAGVQSNVTKFVQNSQAVSLQAWQQAAVNKGAQRLASGATAAESKMANVFNSLFPYIAQSVGSLPARGTLDQNIARSAAFQRAMANYKKS